jgi:hypothetical protein
LWERWKRGESVSEIGRALGRERSTIHRTLREYGGIAPPERRRSRLVLSLHEREEISRGVAAGESARRIAARLGRSPSTITRELDRHGGRHRYRAAEADRRAWDRARRPQPCKLARSPVLRDLVAAKLQQDWSPEQIAGWLKLAFRVVRPTRRASRRAPRASPAAAPPSAHRSTGRAWPPGTRACGRRSLRTAFPSGPPSRERDDRRPAVGGPLR